MFAIHMKNPLASKARAQEEERRILERHQSDREERDKTRAFGFESRNHVGNALKGGSGGYTPAGKMSLAERSKYQFEGDDSDDEKEREIENNLDALGAVTGRLRGLAMATSQEVDRQNVQIEKIMKKVGFRLSSERVTVDANTCYRAIVSMTKSLSPTIGSRISTKALPLYCNRSAFYSWLQSVFFGGGRSGL